MPTFHDLLQETIKLYKSLKKIKYVHLNNAQITFGSSGFKHLLYKDRKERPISEQYRKLSLLRYLPNVFIDKKPTIGFRIIDSYLYGKIEYVSIICVINNRKIKVILRKLGDGNYHFWSIMDL